MSCRLLKKVKFQKQIVAIVKMSKNKALYHMIVCMLLVDTTDKVMSSHHTTITFRLGQAREGKGKEKEREGKGGKEGKGRQEKD